jgi:hypothetical protein
MRGKPAAASSELLQSLRMTAHTPIRATTGNSDGALGCIELRCELSGVRVEQRVKQEQPRLNPVQPRPTNARRQPDSACD